MSLREDIEHALADAVVDLGVRQLRIGGDEAVWVAGVVAVDGSLEVRVGERGPRRGLRRRRADRRDMEALGFRKGNGSYDDAWTLALDAGPGQPAAGAAAAARALGLLGVDEDVRAEVFFSQRGAPDLVAAVEALRSGAEDVAGVDTGRSGPTVVVLNRLGDERIRVQSLWPDGGALDLPGFERDGRRRLSFRDVQPDEAVAAAQAALAAHPARAERPMFIHLGR